MRSPSSLHVPIETGAATSALVYSSAIPASAALILGHGAGSGQLSPFIVDFANALSSSPIDVVTFNFLYMEQKRKLPDRRPILEVCYKAVIDEARRQVASASQALFIGGKSMGGRIATHVAAADAAIPLRGLVLLGYPLHPPGRPADRRDAHLPDVRRPMLFVQGSKDAFGTPEELDPVLRTLSPSPTLFIVDGGDHSFKTTRNRERQAATYAEVKQTISSWILRNV